MLRKFVKKAIYALPFLLMACSESPTDGAAGDPSPSNASNVPTSSLSSTFDLYFTAGTPVSTFKFVCKTPVRGVAEESKCGQNKISDLRIALGLRPQENHALNDFHLQNNAVNAVKVSTLSPSYQTAGSENGGFSVVLPNPAGTLFRRLLVTLNADGNSEAPDYWVQKLNNASTFVSPEDAKAAEWVSPYGVTVKSDGGAPAFSKVASGGAGYIVASDFIEVDTAATYKLSGLFKSNGSILSQFYLGLDTFDKSMNQITSERVIRLGNAGTITDVDDSSISVQENLSGWSTGIAYHRSLGFYFDGDTSKLPDVVHFFYTNGNSTDPQEGAFSAASGNSIQLNTPIPAWVRSQIVPNVTKVMNQAAGGTYLYSASGNAPANWQLYQGQRTGEAFGNGTTTFRTGTKYVRIIVLSNYRQTSGSELLFKDLKLERQ